MDVHSRGWSKESGVTCLARTKEPTSWSILCICLCAFMCVYVQMEARNQCYMFSSVIFHILLWDRLLTEPEVLRLTGCWAWTRFKQAFYQLNHHPSPHVLQYLEGWFTPMRGKLSDPRNFSYHMASTTEIMSGQGKKVKLWVNPCVCRWPQLSKACGGANLRRVKTQFSMDNPHLLYCFVFALHFWDRVSLCSSRQPGICYLSQSWPSVMILLFSFHRTDFIANPYILF